MDATGKGNAGTRGVMETSPASYGSVEVPKHAVQRLFASAVGHGREHERPPPRDGRHGVRVPLERRRSAQDQRRSVGVTGADGPEEGEMEKSAGGW